VIARRHTHDRVFLAWTLFALPLAMLVLLPAAASAQLALNVRAEFGFASSYLDRGVIRTNQPVIQPGLGVSLPAGAGTATIGLWATVEPATFTGTRYFSMAPGGKSPNVTEFRPSLELTQPVGKASVAFKATMQMFPNLTGLTKEANTLDLASTVALARAPLSPALMVAYDVGAINGAYLEGRVKQALPIAKGAAFVLSARAGWSIKQTVDSVPEAFAAYQRDGFTHLDMTLGAALPVAGALVTPYLSYTYVPSPLVSATMPGRQERTTLVFGTSIVVAGKFPKAKPAK
jgi:hypothetical protein